MIRDRLNRERVSDPAPRRHGRAVHRPHRRHRAQAVHLRRRIARQDVRDHAKCRPSIHEAMEKARHDVIEAAVSHDETLIEKYLSGKELTNDEIRHAIRTATVGGSHRARALRRLVQEQGRAGDARCGRRLSSVAGRHAADEGTSCMGDDTVFEERPANDDEPFAGLAFKIATDPFVGKLTFFRVYSGLAQRRLVRLQRDEGQARARRPSAPDARQQARGDPGSARRRHRRGDRTQGHAHRRHDDDDDAPIILEAMKFPNPVIDVAIEPKTKADQDKLGDRATEAVRGRSDVPRPLRSGNVADDHLRHGRAAPRDHRRPHAARVQGRREHRSPAGRVSRDDHASASRRSKASSFASRVVRVSTATW